jgi:hypothetical protein
MRFHVMIRAAIVAMALPVTMIGLGLQPAQAGNGQFGVSVQVVAPRAEAALLDTLPLPPQAQPLAGGLHERLYMLADSPGAALAFYAAELAPRGYVCVQLQHDADGVTAQWRSAVGELRMHAQAVLGQTPATRLRLRAIPARRGA